VKVGKIRDYSKYETAQRHSGTTVVREEGRGRRANKVNPLPGELVPRRFTEAGGWGGFFFLFLLPI